MEEKISLFCNLVLYRNVLFMGTFAEAEYAVIDFRNLLLVDVLVF